MAHRRAEPPVLLTHYQALDMYLNEVRSIRESRVLVVPDPQFRGDERQQLSRGGSTRGTDHESSEEEGGHVSNCLCVCYMIITSTSTLTNCM